MTILEMLILEMNGNAGKALPIANQQTEKGILFREDYMDPYFFVMLKLHKNPMCPPGHPIVAGMNSLSSGPSDYVDFFLQMLVKQLPVYIQDSNHVLEILDKYIWEDN